MATVGNGMPKRHKVLYTADYRIVAVAPAERIGVAAASSELASACA